ncbi:cyclic GMP-AMP synthase-like receptor isoform X1 [Tribolium castaneum]|uniref:cyclic GMP-AMP synthase-like receptor isoform X1 n=1 Tax=Tribolium castaneum TaxID=7070 RepID=UPI0030FF3DA9
MKKKSPAFKNLKPKIFGSGSSFEGLKVGQPGEFDIDVLLTLPEETQPVVKPSNVPGFVQLQLPGFDKLTKTDPELHKVMCKFVDNQNYLLTTQMKSSFMQSIFDKTFPMSGRQKITRVQSQGPALTLTIEGFNISVLVDLVPCFILPERDDFFLVPKEPKREHSHLARYWRLSFQKQERELMFDKNWMKPTIRVMKMLERYLRFLENKKIPYFWNRKLDLLDNLTVSQKEQCEGDVRRMLDDIKKNPTAETILKYCK